MPVVSDFATGFGCFVAGLRAWATKPKLMLLGALPAIIVSACMFLLVWWSVPRTYGWVTGWTVFADAWSPLFREGLRISLGIALAIAIIVFCILSFVTVTLLVGTPFYERIWRATERTLGGIDGEVTMGLGQQVSRGIGDVVRTLRMALVTAVLGFLIGLVPVVGGLAAALFVTYRGSRALAVELTSFAADARGWSFEDRTRALDRRPALGLGLGLPCYLGFIVPGGAVLLTPSAVVAGTLLARELASSQRAPGRGRRADRP